jgi:hypothetical protein
VHARPLAPRRLDPDGTAPGFRRELRRGSGETRFRLRSPPL